MFTISCYNYIFLETESARPQPLLLFYGIWLLCVRYTFVLSRQFEY
jgi:hypothetical protein